MIFLTFDTDHMDDARMREFLSSVPIPGSATIFCTQPYESLKDTVHEIGPHPYLPAGGDWDAELTRMRTYFPKAKGWRAHSCVYSHLLAKKLYECGYAYASTNDTFGIPSPRPARSPWGIWQVPIYYMDNMDFSAIEHGWRSHKAFAKTFIDVALADPNGWYVFDFHPIHLMLNSDTSRTYFDARARFLAGNPVGSLAHKGYGTRSFYLELLSAMADSGVVSQSIESQLDAIEHF